MYLKSLIASDERGVLFGSILRAFMPEFGWVRNSHGSGWAVCV